MSASNGSELQSDSTHSDKHEVCMTGAPFKHELQCGQHLITGAVNIHYGDMCLYNCDLQQLLITINCSPVKS